MSVWKEYKLGEIADVRDGTHDSPKQKTIGKPLVTSKHIKGGKIDLTSTYLISDEDFQQINKRSKVDKWDVLFSMIGTIGEMVVVENEIDFAIKNVGLFKTNDEYISKWIYYYFKSPEAQNEVSYRLKGSTQQYISLTDLRNFPIKMPSKELVKEIVEILSSLDDKIELNNKINQELETLAQTLFKQWFIDFEFPNENGEPYKSSGGEMVDSELGEIPKGWRVETLKDEFVLNMGQSPSGDTYNTIKDGMIFFQGRSDFGFRFPSIRMYTNAPKKIAKKFETLISVRAPVGDINMASEDCCIGRGLGAISHPNKLYTYSYYKILSIQEVLKSYDNEGTVFGSINKETLGNIKNVKPPYFLSESYNDLFCDLDFKINALVKETQELVLTRDTLLPNLISGELEFIKQ
jgi:type I restriction enzyme S subunit